MSKMIYIVFISFTLLHGESFEDFLKSSLKQSSTLKEIYTNVKKTELKAQIQTRWENPEVDISLARYENDDGISVGFMQTIPSFTLNRERKKLAKAQKKMSYAKYKLFHANFVKDISLSYLKFVKTSKLLDLAKEESTIAYRIYDISKQRFHAGNIAKTNLLQSKLAYHQSLQLENRVKLQKDSDYYTLLKTADISKEMKVDITHKFVLKDSILTSPMIELLQSKKDISTITKKISKKTITSFSLFGEMEKEPEQDIFRLGLSMPVALFHQKSEEKKIALLETDITKYNLQKYEEELSLLKEKLKKERISLANMLKLNQELLEQQQEMLKLFEDGYKLAKVNLLELQTIKNSLIQTEKEKITLEQSLDTNTILYNYINGAYNE